MNTIKHALLTLCLSVSAGLAPMAQAASWVKLTDPATSGFSVGGKNVTYGSVAADTVWVYDGANPSGGQNAVDIQSLISSKFDLPLSGAGSLVFAAQGDLASSKSGSFTVSSSFDYLAVHYGRGELLFHWDTPVAANTVVSIGNLPRGLSNFRAFNSVSAVPEPATYGMMLLGLGLVGFAARRRRA